MTSTGMIQHEGSSVPRDLRKSSVATKSNAVTYVLDISDIALQVSRQILSDLSYTGNELLHSKYY